MLHRLLLEVLVVSVLLITSFQFRSVTTNPVSTHNMTYGEADDFDIGEPITEEELNSDNISFSEDEYESDRFIPWGKPGTCDIIPTTRNNILTSRDRWPNAKIPYVISAVYTPKQRVIIGNGMRAFHNKTCVRFVRRTTEKNYIRIKKTGEGFKHLNCCNISCWSDIGMIGLRQTVSLDDKCILREAPGIVIHELMHVLGFYHEHQRPDRDKYVSINLSNVDPKKLDHFEKLKTWNFRTTRFSYDYGSVMHYRADAFAKDTDAPVIIPLRGKPVIGNRRNFSPVNLTPIFPNNVENTIMFPVFPLIAGPQEIENALLYIGLNPIPIHRCLQI